MQIDYTYGKMLISNCVYTSSREYIILIERNIIVFASRYEDWNSFYIIQVSYTVGLPYDDF